MSVRQFKALSNGLRGDFLRVSLSATDTHGRACGSFQSLPSEIQHDRDDNGA